MSKFNFLFPNILFVILPIVLFMFLKIKKNKHSAIGYSLVGVVSQAGEGTSRLKFFLPDIFRTLTLLLLVIALSRPQFTETQKEITSKGIDIVLAMDISSSMKAEDFQPENRLEVAKKEAKNFIQWRKHDRIGFVAFSGESLTECPLTLDHNILLSMIDNVQIGMLPDGTAIGLAIANAVARLHESKIKNKIIIILTDGENNAGQIDPITAAELANTFNIKVYTIGIGKEGLVPYPEDDPITGRRYRNVEVSIDEESLQKISQITGGLYFRAQNNQSLRDAYQRINNLEKSKIKMEMYYKNHELFPYFLYTAFALIFLEIFMRFFLFIKIP